MKSKDLIFILVLTAFTGVSYYGSHMRSLLSKNFFYVTLAIGGVLAVLWLMLRLESFTEPAEGPCAQCGAWVRKGAKFCGKCGARVPAGSLLSLVLDLIFFRWVRINSVELSSPETQTAVPYQDAVPAGDGGEAEDAAPATDEELNVETPEENVLTDYVSYPVCVDCGNRCDGSTEYCPVCGGRLQMHENRKRTAVEMQEAYEAMLAERAHVLEYKHLTFWDCAFRGKGDTTESEMNDLADLMEAYGHAQEAGEMRDKASEISSWKVLWAGIYILVVFAIYGITSIFK